MKSNKNFAQRIYEFLDKYAGIRPTYDPQHDDEYEKYTSPDAAQMKYCADMIANGIKPFQCHSEWESGGYKPYSSKEGREEHDFLVNEIYKFINSKEQLRTSRDISTINFIEKRQITEEDIVKQFPEDNDSDPNSGIDGVCYAKREGARWAVKKIQDSLSAPDIQDKLTPFKNLIAMIENGLAKGSVQVHGLVLKEIEECKKSIEYLSSNPEK